RRKCSRAGCRSMALFWENICPAFLGGGRYISGFAQCTIAYLPGKKSGEAFNQKKHTARKISRSRLHRCRNIRAKLLRAVTPKTFSASPKSTTPANYTD